jgi:hypothetical protein
MAPVVFLILKQLGYRFDAGQLAEYVSISLKNYRKIEVGKIEAAVKLEKAKR